MGLWPSVAPTGYLNSKNVDQKGHIFIDPQRAPVIKEMFERVATGASGRKIYRWLHDVKFLTRNGKPLTLSNIYMILSNHFYYGTFEYPKNSGRWFQGRHVPLFSKDLFDEAQKQIQLHRKVRTGNKEFAFTKLMSCGLCGSGISAEEKYKTLKDGTITKYIYYGCTRFHNIDCRGGYIEEKQLIIQLLELMDKIDLDRSGIRRKLEAEIERHKKFHSNIMGMKSEEYKVEDVDIRNYAKYVLNDGTIFEKRDLMSCLKSKLNIKEKRLCVG
jgi:hypothetical protein